ncbi:MAG: ABC-F family ATP-binding cassette domain-containing protein [Bryobacter sp.]|nr:ABC-F family ATP-binding cassette domain-containing protein [Bryobacter sp.]
MGLLLSCQNLGKQFGATILFQNVSFTVEEGQRLGLIGPNGAGKSTMLKMLAGQEAPDSGEVALRKGVKITYVPQDPEFPAGAKVGDYLTPDNIWFGLAGFRDAAVETATLSGGWKKRLAIAHGAAQSPDLLFLDEPTNHLDLEGILWLERSLRQAPFATVFISHDRLFLENTATHLAELNRVYPEGIFRVEGNYTKFLERREQYFEAERRRKEGLEAVVRRELSWLGRKARARTRKSQARIDSAHALIDELAGMEERERVSSTKIDFSSTFRQTKRLVELEKVTKALGGKQLFTQLDLVLTPGVKLGIAGANGAGKSTLMKLILGQLAPDAGEVRRAEHLRMVYFDQNREQLDPSMSLKQALSPTGDSVIFQDRTLHVNAWAKRFLFETEQLGQPVGRLSGGERARVHIARLMLEPADVLMLDEPTNDLDIPTLGVLEESLEDFSGALVLVTHDRYLLDKISTHVLGLDGLGGAQLYADYEQFEEDLAGRRKSSAAKANAANAPKAATPKKKLSYKDQLEYDGLEAKISAREEELAAAQAEAARPEIASDPEKVQAAYARIAELEESVQQLYERWGELEAKLEEAGANK